MSDETEIQALGIICCRPVDATILFRLNPLSPVPDAAAGSIVKRCELCSEDVWASPEQIRKGAELDAEGATIMWMCLPCGLKASRFAAAQSIEVEMRPVADITNDTPFRWPDGTIAVDPHRGCTHG